MNEDKKDKKTERLGIIAIYLLPVSTIAAMLSLKNILSKMAMALLVLLAPGYIYVHYATLAPAL
jgi:uncharacterized membrane protein